MKVVVADDEEPARRLLIRLLGQLGGISVVAEAADGIEALAAVGREAPELLLLDIDMPELDGLELAARYAHLPPVVFVTAHAGHALQAFDVGAVDYVLKPVQLERLATALARARERNASAAAPLEALLRTRGVEGARVLAQERGELLIFDATGIDRFHASDKYTMFSVDGREHLTEEPLTALEERLRAFGFLRVHRAELVRVAAIRALTSAPGGHQARLADGQVVRVSRRFLPDLKRALGT
jgi:two-component system LytT family response regulator